MKINRIIIYAVSGFFVLSFLFFMVSMAYTSIDTVTAANLDERLAVLEKKAVDAAKEEASRNEWRNIDKIIDAFKKEHLMKMDEFAKFRSDLNVIFMKNRLLLLPQKKVRHNYKAMFDDIIKVNISFIVTGTYPDFKRFIHEMNTKTYKDKMVIIRHVHLSKRDRGDISGDFSMEVYLAK
jgi:hypothetical protein